MNKNLTRRKMLKTSTAALGAVAGAGLLKGFPAIHAADAPVIRYLGTAVNMGDAVQKKLFDDTGIKVKFIVKTTDEVTKTIFTQPNSFDIVDSEYFSMPKLVPSGNLLVWIQRGLRNGIMLLLHLQKEKWQAKKLVIKEQLLRK